MYCKFCNTEKEIERFSKKKSKLGYSLKCKDCHNKYVKEIWYLKNAERHRQSVQVYKKANPEKIIINRHLLKDSIEEISELLVLDSCEICNSKKNLCIDHCHKTNVARGVLCMNCNTLLGRLGDDLDSLNENYTKYYKYLSKNQ